MIPSALDRRLANAVMVQRAPETMPQIVPSFHRVNVMMVPRVPVDKKSTARQPQHAPAAHGHAPTPASSAAASPASLSAPKNTARRAAKMTTTSTAMISAHANAVTAQLAPAALRQTATYNQCASAVTVQHVREMTSINVMFQ